MQSACMQDADNAVLNRIASRLSLDFHKILKAASAQGKDAAAKLVSSDAASGLPVGRRLELIVLSGAVNCIWNSLRSSIRVNKQVQVK